MGVCPIGSLPFKYIHPIYHLSKVWEKPMDPLGAPFTPGWIQGPWGPSFLLFLVNHQVFHTCFSKRNLAFVSQPIQLFMSLNKSSFQCKISTKVWSNNVFLKPMHWVTHPPPCNSGDREGMYWPLHQIQ